MVLGDGISAKKFEEGDVLIIRTEKTAGLGGNLNSFTTTFPNVPTQVTYDGYTVIENSDVSFLFPLELGFLRKGWVKKPNLDWTGFNFLLPGGLKIRFRPTILSRNG